MFKKYRDPKLVLISIILSQNSTDKSALKAFENFYKNMKENKIKSRKDIEESIRVAGLARQKSYYIESVLKLDNEFLKNLLNKDTKDAKEELMKLKGIGEKTADVFLSLYGKEVFPVDRHIMRIGKKIRNWKQL